MSKNAITVSTTKTESNDQSPIILCVPIDAQENKMETQAPTVLYAPVATENIYGVVRLKDIDDRVDDHIEGSEYIDVEAVEEEDANKLVISINENKIDTAPIENSDNLVLSGGVYSDLNDINTRVGDNEDLHTTEKETFVGAINELKTRIDEKTDIDGKIAEHNNDPLAHQALNNLLNYYKKSETYTQSEVNALIGSITKIEFVYVEELPEASEETLNKIYLVPKESESETDVKDEFITIRNGEEESYTYSWEKIGNTEIDLSNYYTKPETKALYKGSEYISVDDGEEGTADEGKKVVSLDETNLETATPTEDSDKLITSGAVYTALSDKANDNEVVHLTGNETISGVKTFSNGIKTTILNNQDGVEKLDISGGAVVVNNIFRPKTNNNRDLGTSSYKWREAFINKLTGETQSAKTDDIINGTFNVINANDITNNTLTQAQYDLITNGKPTMIVGGSATRILEPGVLSNNGLNYIGLSKAASAATAGGVITYQPYQITVSTRKLQYNTQRLQFNQAAGTVSIVDGFNLKGKLFPNYPSNPTSAKVLTYGTDDTLAWSDFEEPDLTNYVDLTSDQTITGKKEIKSTFNVVSPNNVKYSIGSDTSNNLSIKNVGYNRGIQIVQTGDVYPTNSNVLDLGTSYLKWKNLYLGGNLSDGTHSLSVAQIAAIKDIAEGKTKSFVIDTKSQITGTEDDNQDFTNVTAITGVTIADLKLGDIILIKELEVPDYWVSELTETEGVVTSVSLYKLETSKVDLSSYYTKSETDNLLSSKSDDTDVVHLAGAETISGEKTFSTGLQVTSRNDYKWGILPTAAGAALQFGRIGATEGQYNIYPLGIRPNANNQVLGHLNRFARINVDEIAATHTSTPAKVQDIIDGTFNVINASDIASTNILTEAQLATITNGKPTIIKGSFRGYTDAIYKSPVNYGTVDVGTFESNNEIGGYIIQSSRLLEIRPASTTVINLRSIGQINGKTIPSYPTNPTENKVLTYKTDGTMGWVDAGGTATTSWGAIGGDLADQTDLSTALSAKADDSDVVHKTGDETVAGTKTFTDKINIKIDNKSYLVGKDNSGLFTIGESGGSSINFTGAILPRYSNSYALGSSSRVFTDTYTTRISDGTNTKTVAAIANGVNLAETALQPSDIVNNITSTATNKALSANMGKELQDQITYLKQRGRYLSVWDCTTGLAKTTPVSPLPYTYSAGDYFIVGVVGTTNYIPTGSSYTGTASTTTTTDEVHVNDTYYYDGSQWTLLASGGQSIAWGTITGTLSSQTDLNNALNAKMDKSNPTGTGSFSLNRKANTTIGNYSFAEGRNTTASNSYSHAEGNATTASGVCAHAEGGATTASGYYSHAEGDDTEASGYYSHAEGDGTEASGDQGSHAEGHDTTASGWASHAEGTSTTASANYSHAEGNFTTASGPCSHAEGWQTVAQRTSQHVFGEYNVLDTEGTTVTHGKYIEIVGNGSDGDNRSNARTLDWSGNETLAGSLTCNGTLSDGTNIVTITQLNGLSSTVANKANNSEVVHLTGAETVSGNKTFTGIVIVPDITIV